MTKEKISIALLGKWRFYIGLSIGIFMSILVFLLFGYYRELLRWHTFDSDLFMPTEKEFFLYNLFFAGISVTIGFGVTVWFWFAGLFSSKRPLRRINYISTFSIFWSMTLLYVITKIGFNTAWMLLGMSGYDDHLNLAKELPLFLFLLPTVFFLNIWVPIRLSFRSENWFFKSLMGFVVLSIILAMSTPIDQRRLNESWNQYMEPYNQIVDNEIMTALSKGVQLPSNAVETIRFNQKERVIRLVKNLKVRFISEKPVPVDTVVLELIAIKKTTVRSLDGDWDDKIRRWPFALPRDVFRHIEMNEDSIKNGYLLEILAEYESIFTKDWENDITLSESGLWHMYDNRSSMQRWYKEIFFELECVNEKLKQR